MEAGKGQEESTGPSPQARSACLPLRGISGAGPAQTWGPVWLERGLGVLRNGVLPAEAINKGGHSQQRLPPLWPVSPEGVEAEGAGSRSRGAPQVRASARPGSRLPHAAAASCSTVNDSLGTPGIVARQAAPSMGLRQDHWSDLLLASFSGELPDPGLSLCLLH